MKEKKSLDKTKPYFVQHIPAACSEVEQREYNYNGIQEVFKNEIGLFANNPEFVWARGGENLLMLSSTRCLKWFVIGRIYNDDISFLPYYREVYPTAPPCCEDMFPMIEQCSDKEFVKGYYKKKGKIKNGRSRQC